MFNNPKFWIDVLERTIKTFAQTLAGLLIGVDVIAGEEIAFVTYLLAAGVAALVAFLMGVAGSQIGASTTAAWLPPGPDTDRG